MDEFVFDGRPVRGVLVQLTHAWTDAWTQILRRNAGSPAFDTHGPTLTNLLGQLTAAAVLLQGQTHIDGGVTMQIDGFGPLQRATVDLGRDTGLHVTAKVDDPIHTNTLIPTLTLSLAPADAPPWQSTVQMTYPSDTHQVQLGDVLQRLMLQSAQLETTWVLAADDAVAAGLLVWRWPPADTGPEGASPDGDPHHEACHRIGILASSLTPRELVTLDADTILRRLFWQEPWHRENHPPPSAYPSTGGE